MKDFESIKGDLTPKLSWSEWKNRWESCGDLPTALGLLHSVYQTVGDDGWALKDDQRRERDIFLLKLADGGSFLEPETEVLSAIRDKAFKVVSIGCFKPGTKSEESSYSMHPELRDTLLWFFNDHGRRSKGGNEFSGEYAKKLCHSFVRSKDPAVMGVALEIMYRRHWLWSLLPESSLCWNWDWINDQFVEKLKEFGTERHETIEAAIVDGNKAARLYLIISTGVAERNRQKEVERLKCEMRAGQERLQELGSVAT